MAPPLQCPREKVTYLGMWLDQDDFLELLRPIRDMAGLDTMLLPEGVRRRTSGKECFWFNYNEEAIEVAGLLLDPISVICQITE